MLLLINRGKKNSTLFIFACIIREQPAPSGQADRVALFDWCRGVSSRRTEMSITQTKTLKTNPCLPYLHCQHNFLSCLLSIYFTLPFPRDPSSLPAFQSFFFNSPNFTFLHVLNFLSLRFTD